MKGIYLASGSGYVNYYNVVYQDLIVKRDLQGCMLDIDIS